MRSMVVLLLIRACLFTSSLKGGEDKEIQEMMHPDTYKFVTGIDCNSRSCRASFGQCIDSTTCKCNRLQVNIDRAAEYCSYTVKDQKTAFFLELFLPFGTSHYYLGKTTAAFFKNVFFTGSISILALVYKSYKVKTEMTPIYKAISIFFGVIMIFGYLVWHIVDLGMLGTNGYKDAFGIELYRE